MAAPFKTCSCCAHVWPSRQAFLDDPATQLVGYQAFLEELELGLFLFDHGPCGTTMAIPGRDFADLYHGPIFDQRMDGSELCVGYCHQVTELKPCSNLCECAWVREVLQVVRAWPKDGQPAAAAVR